MTSSIIFLLVLVTLTVVWIEGKPEVLDRLIRYPMWAIALGVSLISSGIAVIPDWWGWILILAGLVELIEVYRALNRREQVAEFLAQVLGSLQRLFVGLRPLAAAVFGTVRRMAVKVNLPGPAQFITTPSSVSRVVGGTVALFVFSPIAAIPAALVTGLLFVSVSLIAGDAYLMDTAVMWQEALKRILGYTYVILIVTLDVVFRWFFVALPVFIGICFVVAKKASLSSNFWKRLLQGSLLVGAVYPVAFILADRLNLLDGPLFN